MLAIYCRRSVDKEEETSGSIKLQKKLGKDFARKMGWEYTYYIDEDVSGTLENKPQFVQMLVDMSSKDSKIKAVFAQDQSRLYRNDEVRLQFLSLCRKIGIEIYYQSGKFDWSNPEMKLLDSILSAIGVFHVDITREKIKSVLRMNAEAGKVHGILPFGYHSVEQIMEVHPEHSKVVMKIFEMSMAGMGSSTISQQLNLSKTPTYYNERGGERTTTDKITGKKRKMSNNDSKWHPRTVLSILKNPVYMGKWTYSNLEINSPIIIEPDVFEKTQKMIEERIGHTGKRNTHDYLLNDLVYCAKCGKRMTGRKVSKLQYYRCVSLIRSGQSCGNGGIRLGELDELLWSCLFNQRRLIELVKDNLKNINDDEKVVQLELEMENNEKLQQSLQIKKTDSIRMVLEHRIEESDIKTIVDEIKKEISILKSKHLRLKEELNHLDTSKELSKDIEERLSTAKVDTPFNEKRRLLFEYIERVEVLNNDKHVVKVFYKIDGIKPDTFTINKEYTMAILEGNKGNSISLINKNAFHDSEYTYLEHEQGWWDIYPNEIPSFDIDEEYLKYLENKGKIERRK